MRGLDQRLGDAAGDLGRARAVVQLPGWPAHCRAPVDHARLAVGMDPVVAARLERAQLDYANQRAANCASHYDSLRAQLATAAE